MIKEVDGQGNTVYRYVKCPACGSKKRHFEEMSEKAIKMDLAGKGYLEALIHQTRVVADPVKLAGQPLGAEAPSITFALDICKDCGMVYAPMVITGKAKKTLTPPKLILPGQPQ